MTLDTPDGYSRAFYSSYVNLLLSIFHMACRDLSELRHLVSLFFFASLPLCFSNATNTPWIYGVWQSSTSSGTITFVSRGNNCMKNIKWLSLPSLIIVTCFRSIVVGSVKHLKACVWILRFAKKQSINLRTLKYPCKSHTATNDKGKEKIQPDLRGDLPSHC